MKIVATLFFEGDGEQFGPEWEARVEGLASDTDPHGHGSTAEEAIADLKEWFCPCDVDPDPVCTAAAECQRAWEDA